MPVKEYTRFLSSNGLEEKIASLLASIDFEDEKSVESSSQAIKDLIIASPIDPSVAQEIERSILAIDPSALWAVRSSAVSEDLPTASFAGQQDTFLNVRGERAIEFVKQCWASYWNARAMLYRHNAGIAQIEKGIAVIVQKMIDARSSGVLFTADPVSGKRDRIIIESSWGLGESIVSGLVSPDRFVIDKKRSKIIEKTISKKTKGIFYSVQGPTMVEIEPAEQLKPSLGDRELKKLQELSAEVEAYFNSPQDVEWALEGDQLWLLQSRPITTVRSDAETLWTRAYGDEYWADVTSPLFFSLLGEYLTKYVNQEGSKIMGYRDLTDKELLRVNKGHIYFNSEVLEEVFTYNPKFSRTKELLNYFPEKDQYRVANARTRIAKRLWAEARIAVLDNEGTIFRTDKAYRKWSSRFLQETARFNSTDLTKLSDGDLYQEYGRMEDAYLKHFRLIRYGMVTHSIGTNLMIKRWLVDWLGDRSGAYYSKLISGLPENKTIRTNIALAKLSRSPALSPKIKQDLLSMSSQEFLRNLRSDANNAPFLQDLNEFLKDYGHRSHTREMYFPRWEDDPTLVVDVVRNLLESDVPDLEQLEKDKIAERIRTEQEIMEKISKIPNGWAKKRIFHLVMRYAQTYLVFRENQRFYFDYIVHVWRRLFLEYGRRFAERGILDEQTDIFFLSKEEIWEISEKGTADIRGLIKRRREEFDHYRNILPPKFLKGNMEFDDTVVVEQDALRVTGTSASPGIFTGVLRVVESIEHLAEVKDREILVTTNTDPGWTSVFAKLGGLITETGGILSHGAVVSREYGIPAVTAVMNATKIFKTGQRATIDGNEGIIYILEAKDD